MFHWAGPFLGPGKWACEPYFSSPISFDFKLLSNLIHLGYVGDNLDNAVFLNSGFIKKNFKPLQHFKNIYYNNNKLK